MSPVVLITGCSEGGIGNYLAQAFLRAGCTVWATARKVEKMKNLESWSACRRAALDINDHANIEAVYRDIIERDGKVDVLVNNAGYGVYGIVTDIPQASIKANFQTNVFALLDLVQTITPIMAKQGHGKIINIGSISSDIPFPAVGVYGSTKAAVEYLTHCLRQELV
ncbi:hypothetical protein HDU91_000337, partial [Kappamyces sp. JEL0680]